MSIKIKLIILFIAFSMAPVIILGALSVKRAQDYAHEATLARLRSMADAKAKMVETYFAERRGDLQVIQSRPGFKGPMPILDRFLDSQQDPAFRTAQAELNSQLLVLQHALKYRDVVVANPSGRVLCAVGPEYTDQKPGARYHDFDGKIISQGRSGFYVSEVYIDSDRDNQREMVLAGPVSSNEDGHLLGVIILVVDLDPVFKDIGDTRALGQTGEMVLATREGDTVKFLSPLRFQAKAPRQETVPFRRGGDVFPAQAAVTGQSGAGRARDYHDWPVLAAWRWLPALGWGLVVKIDEDEVLAPARHQRDLVLLMGIGVILIGSLLAWLFGRSLTRPLVQLERGAEIIGGGDLDHQIQHRGRDEVGRLAQAFNQMTLRLKTVTASRDELNAEIEERRRAEQAVRKAAAYNRSLIEASLDPLVTIGPDGKITDVNQATEKTTGRSRAELIGSDFSDYFTDPERARAGYRKVFKEGTVTDYALEIKGADGRLVPVLYNASLYRDDTGAVVGIFAAARDITARRRAEAEAARAKRALYTLSQVNQGLVRAQSEEQLLPTVCRILVEDGGYRMSWIGYKIDDENKTVRPVAQAGFEDGYLESAAITWDESSPRGRGPTGKCIGGRAPVVCQHFRDDPAFLPWREEALKRGYASSFSAPLLDGDNVLGALMVYSADPEAFGEEEVNLLKELTDDLAYGIVFHRTRIAHLRADEAARKQEALLRQVVSNAPIILHALDRNEIITVSEGKGLTGFKRPPGWSAVGKSLSEVYPNNPEVVAANRRTLAGESFRQDLSIGDTILSSWFEPLREPGGEISGMIGVSTDVTDLRRATAELQRSKDELEIRIQERTAELRASEERYRLITDVTSDYVLTIRRDEAGQPRLTYVSESFGRLTGYPGWKPDDFTRDRIQFVHPDDLAVGQASMARAFNGEVVEFQNRLLTRDGGFRWIELHLQPIWNQDHTRVEGFHAAGKDITARKRSETALRESEERFRSTLDLMVEGCQIIGHDWRYIYINDTAETHNRRPKEELIGQRYMDMWPGIEQTKVFGLIERALKQRVLQRMENEFEYPDGLKDWFDLIIQPVPEGVFILSVDISERKRIEKEIESHRDHLEELVKTRTAEIQRVVEDLRREAGERERAEARVVAERQQFHEVLETLPAYVVLLTPDYHMPFANRVFRDLFGTSGGRRCYEFLFNRAEPCETCETYTVMKTSAPHRWEWTGPNGRDFDVFDFPFTDTDGSKMILEMGIDITERKQAEAELRKIQSLLNETQQTAMMGGWEYDAASDRVTWTDEVYNLYGMSKDYDPSEAARNISYCDPEDQMKITQAFHDAVETGRPYDLELQLINGRGRRMWARTTGRAETKDGRIVRVFGIFMDITERKRAEDARDGAEQELAAQRALSIRADRLRSLGEMAAGIAHELNQPLAGVRGLAEHLLIGAERGWDLNGEKLREKTRQIMGQADRMSHIIEHVRTFARGADGVRTGPIEVNQVIEDSLSLLGAQLESRGVLLERELGRGLPRVLANPFSLEEVVINLVNNARDALEENVARGLQANAAAIKLRTLHEPGPEGNQVLIEVSDNGPGIPDEVRARIFTPFFTTKSSEKGTGLGLSISQSIIEGFGGRIEIQSRARQGSVVRVSLPAMKE
jgi:PAS domain S-box-containing protein